MSRRAQIALTALILVIGGFFLLVSGAQTDRRVTYIDCGGTIAECESINRRDPIITVERDPVRISLGGVSLLAAGALFVVAIRSHENAATSGSSGRTVDG